MLLCQDTLWNAENLLTIRYQIVNTIMVLYLLIKTPKEISHLKQSLIQVLKYETFFMLWFLNFDLVLRKSLNEIYSTVPQWLAITKK